MKYFFYLFEIFLHDRSSSIKLPMDLPNYQLGVTEGSKVLNSKLIDEPQPCKESSIFCLIVGGLEVEAKRLLNDDSWVGKDHPYPDPLVLDAPSTWSIQGSSASSVSANSGPVSAPSGMMHSTRKSAKVRALMEERG